MINVEVDMENNAAIWWDALNEARPALAVRLRRDQEARLTPDEWEAIQKLPGWDDGPAYARHPLTRRN